MDNTFKQSVDEFLINTASDRPTPGGGSVAALVAALSASLVQMVGNLTVGKKNYQDVEAEVQQLIKQGATLTEQLKSLAAQDMAHFNTFMEVLRMPKDTPEQVRERDAGMQRALMAATKTPLAIGEAGIEVLKIAHRLAQIGSKNAISDAGAAACLATGAIQAALIIAESNFGSIKDQEFLAWAEAEKQNIIDESIKLKEATLADMTKRM